VTGEAARGRELAKRHHAELAKRHDVELAEFADAAPVPPEADPTFREGLREKLWKMVRRQLGREADDSNELG
jgi:hypothetical protein